MSARFRRITPSPEIGLETGDQQLCQKLAYKRLEKTGSRSIWSRIVSTLKRSSFFRYLKIRRAF